MKKPHVVVLGAGFGGLECCRHLSEEDVNITLVDRQNHHLFQPLLYQVATCGLSMPDIAKPIRSIFTRKKNLSILMQEVESIDLDQKKVTLSTQELNYDYLVIALGAVTGYFGNDQWAEFAPGLKSLDDAARIRREILYAFERAEVVDDPTEHQRLLNIVVVGGGPTGVELAGAFAELTNHVMAEDFQKINPREARVILIEAAPKILGMFPEPLPQQAYDQLRALGVEIRLNTPVKDIRKYTVELEDETIEAANIIWAAGVQAEPITRDLSIEKDRGGRIMVEKDCSVPKYPEVFAIGDIASMTDARNTKVPGVSPGAIQMGSHVAGIINRETGDEHPFPSGTRSHFVYWDKGSMATIGRSAAVASVAGLKMSGFIAWVLWLAVHLLFLVGFKNKTSVLLQWFYAYVRYRRGARIITGLEKLAHSN